MTGLMGHVRGHRVLRVMLMFIASTLWYGDAMVGLPYCSGSSVATSAIKIIVLLASCAGFAVASRSSPGPGTILADAAAALVVVLAASSLLTWGYEGHAGPAQWVIERALPAMGMLLLIPIAFLAILAGSAENPRRTSTERPCRPLLLTWFAALALQGLAALGYFCWADIRELLGDLRNLTLERFVLGYLAVTVPLMLFIGDIVRVIREAGGTLAGTGYRVWFGLVGAGLCTYLFLA